MATFPLNLKRQESALRVIKAQSLILCGGLLFSGHLELLFLEFRRRASVPSCSKRRGVLRGFAPEGMTHFLIVTELSPHNPFNFLSHDFRVCTVREVGNHRHLVLLKSKNKKEYDDLWLRGLNLELWLER